MELGLPVSQTWHWAESCGEFILVFILASTAHEGVGRQTGLLALPHTTESHAHAAAAAAVETCAAAE
eukprot:346754-Chlamydomonas_euryale.AAC.2